MAIIWNGAGRGRTIKKSITTSRVHLPSIMIPVVAVVHNFFIPSFVTAYRRI